MASAAAKLIENVALSDMPNGNFLAALQYWLDAKKNRVLPPIEVIEPTQLPRALLSSLVVVSVESGPKKLRIRLFGTKLVDAVGFDPTGQFAEDIGGTGETAERHYACMQSTKPYLYHGPLVWWSRDYKSYTTLVLPFGDAAGRVKRFLDYIELEPILGANPSPPPNSDGLGPPHR